MTDLFVSQSEYDLKVEQLARSIYRSGWRMTQILCVAKGGLRVGDVLSRIFDLPLAVVCTRAYHGVNRQERGQLEIARYVTMVDDHLEGNVLLVDDLVDSGETLRQLLLWLPQQPYCAIAEVRTAVLWCKSCSVIRPDYYVEYLPDNPWIHQPFERYEQLSPQSL
ncbi:MAG: phosphoribosyltransferase [Oscillatoriales cyanobacterium SM2_2_1]|nr:phosphoribosyltransferase [Oscillatoriales cyanobacterium SM2_2_1]